MGVGQSAPHGTLWGQLWKQYSKNTVLGVDEFSAVIRVVCERTRVSMDHTNAIAPKLSSAFQQLAHGPVMKQGVFLKCAPLLYQRGEELVSALRAPKPLRIATPGTHFAPGSNGTTAASTGDTHKMAGDKGARQGSSAAGAIIDTRSQGSSAAGALNGARFQGSSAAGAIIDTRSQGSTAAGALNGTRFQGRSAAGALMDAHFRGSNAVRTRFAASQNHAAPLEEGSTMSRMAGADQIDPDISWVRQLMDMDAAKGVDTTKIRLPGPRRDSIRDGLVVCPEPETLSDAESVRSVESISGFIKTKWDPTVHHKRYLYPADRAVEFSEKWTVAVEDFPPMDAVGGADDHPKTPNGKQYVEDTEQTQQNTLRRRRLLRIREENLRKALDASSVFHTLRRPKTYEDEIVLVKTFYDDVRRGLNLFDGGDA
eukprot:GEMP01044418.1.p1 GENE.GEMP01044418.1~~GEMP01044418.1.p1  ORF type:complete len:426 (+),score=91.70 GEMP01044418.1:97-1374(+)